LPGRSVVWCEDQPDASLIPCGQAAEGVCVLGLDACEMARLEYYHIAVGAVLQDVTVDLADGRCAVVRVFVPVARPSGPVGPWRGGVWQARWAETVMAAATDIMAQYGVTPADTLRRRYVQMLVAGGARARAAILRDGTETLRRRAAKDDTRQEARRWPYAAYFAVDERDLQFRRFDGRMSGTLNRAVFISGDAAVVLPYDPWRDRVMVIEQFRAGPHARGDANPWLIEAVAGRIDAGETPEDAARRETEEEAGLVLQRLIPGPRYYPSPAAKAEYLYSFVGIADLPDGAAGLGGLETEAEDIRSHIIPFDRLMEMVDSGEVDNAPLALLALWLAPMRADLRAGS
jgi:ADP-ribose pyrophosphatase